MRSPRHLETEFRKELGSISPYLSIIDVACKELLSENDKNKIQHIVRRNGNGKLDISNLVLGKTFFFTALSHLAFIHSRAEQFCKDFREYQKSICNDRSSPNLEGLDMLRKVIFYLHTSRMKKDEIPESLQTRDYERYAGSLELKLFDYFRVLRNLELHGGSTLSFDSYPFNPSELAEIKNNFGFSPSRPSEISIEDVILYSKVWQKIAVNLCGNLSDINEVVQQLCKKYKVHSAKRRDHAITNKLRSEYLLDATEINILRNRTNGWVA